MESPQNWICSECGRPTSKPVQADSYILCERCNEIEYLCRKKGGWHFIFVLCGVGGGLCAVIGSMAKANLLELIGVLLLFGNFLPYFKMRNLKNEIKKLEEK